MKRRHGRSRKVKAEIKKLCREIAEKFKPEKIILFGSHAYGTPHEGSDIDLLVIMPYEGRHTQQVIKIHQSLNTLAPLDLIVRTPEEVTRRIEMEDFFMREIVERGMVLYEADHAEIDRQGRRRLGRRAA